MDERNHTRVSDEVLATLVERVETLRKQQETLAKDVAVIKSQLTKASGFMLGGSFVLTGVLGVAYWLFSHLFSWIENKIGLVLK